MMPNAEQSSRAHAARAVARLSIGVSIALALGKILAGWLGHSTSVLADGFESAGDVIASVIVLFGLTVASRPPDNEHPYGHGRFEMLTGLAVGVMLAAAGAAISVHSLERASGQHPLPAAWTVWPLVASIAIKGFLSSLKFRVGRRAQSAALIADARNDSVDMVSGLAALVAVGLTISDPSRFLAADQYGGFAVGLIVVFTGVRVLWETSVQLMDTMPDESLMLRIRQTALEVPGVKGVEKCFARKTGFQYHVDLHLEVDPGITVRESHEIASRVRIRLRESLEFVADVLVHVEPAEHAGERSTPRPRIG
jgi:cation diffusion facilitator family transporter